MHRAAQASAGSALPTLKMVRAKYFDVATVALTFPKSAIVFIDANELHGKQFTEALSAQIVSDSHYLLHRLLVYRPHLAPKVRGHDFVRHDAQLAEKTGKHCGLH